MLIDLTKCIGCRGCQVACKVWNNLRTVDTQFSPDFTNPQARSAYTWTTVEFLTTVVDGQPMSIFAKTQCLHCLRPACEAVCIAGAITKTPAGPVIVNQDKCVGCCNCQEACPFGVPKYQWDKAVPKMQKCTMCADRIAAGLQPACAATCPNGAIVFGERSELLQVAQARIATGTYIDHVYGEREVGGTAILYLSSLPLNFNRLKEGMAKAVVPDFTRKALRPKQADPFRTRPGTGVTATGAAPELSRSVSTPKPALQVGDHIRMFELGIARSVGAPDGVLNSPVPIPPPLGLAEVCYTDRTGRLIMVKSYRDDESAVREAHALLKWADGHREEYPEATVLVLLGEGDHPDWLERAWLGSPSLRIARTSSLVGGAGFSEVGL